MPQVSLKKLLEHLSTRPSGAVAFLHGEEEHLREEAVQRILEACVEPATRDFNLDQWRGPEASAEALASLLATPPLMAEHRVLVVREAQGLAPKAREVVSRCAAVPAPGLILVLTATIPRGSKAGFYGTLKKAAYAVEFPPIDPLDLPAWLTERASGVYGVTLEVNAARALAASVGAQLGILAAELAKLADYVGDRRRITVDDVEAVGGYVPRVDRWAWIDRVGERRFEEALRELPELLDAGDSGVSLVIGLGTHLLRIGLLVAGGREGLDRQLRPNQGWLVNRLLPQARRWTQPQVDRALADLLRTDRLLKSASWSDRQAMEELLLRLAADDLAGRSSAPLLAARALRR